MEKLYTEHYLDARNSPEPKLHSHRTDGETKSFLCGIIDRYGCIDSVKYKKAEYIRGQLVDQYTANLIKTVLNNLHEDNQKIFLAKSVDEMVAIAYKMVTE